MNRFENKFVYGIRSEDAPYPFYVKTRERVSDYVNRLEAEGWSMQEWRTDTTARRGGHADPCIVIFLSRPKP